MWMEAVADAAQALGGDIRRISKSRSEDGSRSGDLLTRPTRVVAIGNAINLDPADCPEPGKGQVTAGNGFIGDAGTWKQGLGAGTWITTVDWIAVQPFCR